MPGPLIAFYDFNPPDHSGNGNDLTTSGTVPTTNGIDGTPNTAMLFNNTGFFQGPVWVSSAPLSMSFFVKFSALTSGELDKLVVLDAGTMWLGMSLAPTPGAGQIVAGFFGPGPIVGTPLIADANWHHLALTVSAVDGGGNVTVTLYKDNVLVGTATGPPTFAGITGSQIGSNHYFFPPTTMEYVAVYDTDIGAAGVDTLWNGGQGFDPTLISGMQEFVALDAADSTFHLTAEM